MHAEELTRLLTSTRAVQDVIQAIDSPDMQKKRNWDLSNWTYRTACGSVCFIEQDAAGKPQCMVVAVEGPKERAGKISNLLTQFPLPTKLIMLG